MTVAAEIKAHRLVYMKLTIITDIHHGPRSHTKASDWNALSVVEQAVEHARTSGSNLLLDLGDHISDADPSSDRRFMREVADVFAGYDGLRAHVLGNHDVNNLAIEESEDIFGRSMGHAVVDLGEARLIAWQPDVRLHRLAGFNATGEALDWLVEALLADERPAIIATHVPVSGHSQAGNYYFENRPHLSTYPDHARIRAAVEKTGRAALWLSGHVHWNTLTVTGGIGHMTVQSASERFTTFPRTAAAFSELEIADGTAKLTVFGNDAFHAAVPFAANGSRRWLPVLRADGSAGGDADTSWQA